jgi:hypothetical protein
VKPYKDAKVLPFAVADCEAGGEERELDPDCVCLGARVGGVCDSGEMQLDSPLPYITKRLRCAARWPAGGAQIAGSWALYFRWRVDWGMNGGGDRIVPSDSAVLLAPSGHRVEVRKILQDLKAICSEK